MQAAACYTVYDASDRVVYHELTHSFVKNTVANVPLWLSEGIAEYVSVRPDPDHVLPAGYVHPLLKK